MWLLILIFSVFAQESAHEATKKATQPSALPPAYEQEIVQKNKVSAETKMQDQKSFYEVINAKTQEVIRYARITKDELVKKQEVVRKDFETKLKAEIAEVKKSDPKASTEPLRKAANEKRRALFEQLNDEKKSLEKNLDSFRERFNEFVKSQKENFREQLKTLSAKVSTPKAKPAESPIQQEFREIPPGPATPLKPQ
jgi:hypothetical protein